MENMIKFYRGLVGNLPEAGVNGALYITTDEGAIYYGTGTGMKRLGDFVQVDNVAALPEKAHESCLYYCVAENILAKWNGTEWKQINKQPTAEEMKTLLGLGSMAYLSEVSEDNLSSALKEKVNAAAEGNHSHSNKTVLDGITAEKVSAWDNAEKNAKDYVDGKDGAMNTRVEALETAIGENGSVATQIKTAIEALDYTDTAVDGEYVSAVNEVDGKITVTRKALPDYSNTYDAKGAAATALDNAKAYADGLASNYDEKGAAAGVKTELTAEINKKVTAVEGKDLIATSEITRLAGMSDGANKVEVSETNGNIKIDGVETVVYTHPASHTVSEISDFDAKVKEYGYATKTELGDVDAKFANYKTATDQKVIDDEQDRRLGVIEVDYLKAADIANFETKENVKKVSDDLAAYVESNNAAVADRYTKAEADDKFAIKGADAYDDEEVRGLISDNADAISELADKVGEIPTDKTVIGLIGEEKARAEGIEGGLRTDVNTIMGDYLKAEDKTELQGNIDTVSAAVERLTNGVSAEEIDGVNDLINYVKEHGPEVEQMQKDIAANAKAITDEVGRADTAEKALAGRLDVLEAIDHEAYKGYADGKADAAKDAAIADAASKYETKGTAQGIVDGLKLSETYEPIGAEGRAIAAAKTETENQVKALADGQVTTNKNDIASLFEQFQWGEF